MGLCMKKTKKQFQWTRAWNGALHAWKTRFVVLVWIFPFLWEMNIPSVSYASARSQYIVNWAATQCLLTSVDSDEPVQPPFKLTNSKRCSVSSLTQRLAKALIRLCICAGWSEALLVQHTTLLEISCHGSIIFYGGSDFAYIFNSWSACLPLIWFGKRSEMF